MTSTVPPRSRAGRLPGRAERRLARPGRPIPEPAGDLVVTSLTAGAGIVAVGLAALESPLLAVLAALLGGLALAVVRRPERIGWTVVAVVPITSGLARGIPVPGVRISEALVAGAAAVVLFRRPAERDRWASLDWAAAAYVGAHVVLSVVSGRYHDALGGESLRLAVGPVQFFLLYRIVVRTMVTPAHRRVALALLVAGTIPVAVLTLAQAAGFGPAQQLIEEITRSEVFERWGWSRQGRSTGPFASWHPLAGYVFLPLVACAVSLAAPEGRSGISRVLAGTGLVACIGALLASQTLNVMAGAVLAVAVAAMAQRRFVRVALPALLAAVLAFSLFGASVAERIDQQVLSSDPLEQGAGTPETISYRFQVWEQQFLPQVERYWLTGYGPELPPAITWRSTESLYFTLVLRGGVVLLIAFAALQVVIIREAWRARESDEPATGVVALTLLATSIALVPMQVLFPYYTASGLPQVLWAFLGLLAAARASQPPATVPTRASRRRAAGGAGR